MRREATGKDERTVFVTQIVQNDIVVVGLPVF